MASCSWEQAWACFHAMRRAGVQPNTRSYNAVSTLSFDLFAVCTALRSGPFAVRHQGPVLLPDAPSCVLRARCCCLSAQPDLLFLAQLLAACERDGEADRALEAFARMEREAPGEYAWIGPDTQLAGPSWLVDLLLLLT